MAKTVKKVATVGLVESIDLPDFKVFGVPAKVDTGADSSSIWASNIRDNNGKLSFKLLGESSPYYNNKTITVTDYQLSSIKNSFGHTELRYKVKLKVSISGKIINTYFTLANRSANTYPVLIGQKTLRGRFVVDVSHRKDKRVKKILLIDVKKIGSVARFIESLEKTNRKVKVTHITVDELQFTVDETGVSASFGSDQDVAKYDFVFFKTFMDDRDPVTALAHYLSHRRVPFIDQAVLHYPLNNKLAQYVVLEDNGIRVPKCLFKSTSELKTSYSQLADFLGLPFVLKDINASKGANNFLIKDKAGFKAIWRKKSNAKLQFIAQAYIPNNGDYRTLVFGKKIAMVIRRVKSTSSTHLNNVSTGGNAKLVDEKKLPASIRKKCLIAASIFNLDVAGLDVIQNKTTGEWYFLEVQHAPQIASGSFVGQKQKAFAKFLQKRLAKS